MGRLWTKRDFVVRNTYLKFPQIFSTRAVNICDKHESKRCFWVSFDMFGEINFQSKIRLRASNFFVWKLLSRQKKKVQGCETFRKFLGSGTETFSDRSKSQTPCNMAVIDTIQWVFIEKVWLFNVAPLDGNIFLSLLYSCKYFSTMTVVFHGMYNVFRGESTIKGYFNYQAFFNNCFLDC